MPKTLSDDYRAGWHDCLVFNVTALELAARNLEKDGNLIAAAALLSAAEHMKAAQPPLFAR